MVVQAMVQGTVMVAKNTYAFVEKYLRVAQAFPGTMPKSASNKSPVLVIKNALSKTCCSKTYAAVLEAIASGNKGSPGTVYTQGGLGSGLATNYRRVNIHSIGLLAQAEETLKELNSLIAKLAYEHWGFKNIVTCAPWWLAGYGAGDKFEEHCDGIISATNGNYKTVDSRLVSAVAYFNTKDSTSSTGFTGGSLVFPGIIDQDGVPLTVNPRQGDLVLFPSTYHFSHKVAPVRAGYRLALTNFFKSGATSQQI
jgi:predicted 2-oxoglutarate/Fe(II)-dependent dioxygenase YbiX